MRNDFYTFSHPQLGEEARETCDEILCSLPDEESDSEPMIYEWTRREAKEEARALLDEL